MVRITKNPISNATTTSLSTTSTTSRTNVSNNNTTNNPPSTPQPHPIPPIGSIESLVALSKAIELNETKLKTIQKHQNNMFQSCLNGDINTIHYEIAHHGDLLGLSQTIAQFPKSSFDPPIEFDPTHQPSILHLAKFTPSLFDVLITPIPNLNAIVKQHQFQLWQQQQRKQQQQQQQQNPIIIHNNNNNIILVQTDTNDFNNQHEQIAKQFIDQCNTRGFNVATLQISITIKSNETETSISFDTCG